MGEWREQHPKANLREIEKVLDERMTKLRAKVLEEAAQQLLFLFVWMTTRRLFILTTLRGGGLNYRPARACRWNVLPRHTVDASSLLGERRYNHGQAEF
ncbi:MAG: hypothetical protein MUO77_19075 [Anaerolineales bacterium]|nr:hypothetical protein [Anaerolineales bacterium]